MKKVYSRKHAYIMFLVAATAGIFTSGADWLNLLDAAFYGGMVMLAHWALNEV